MTLGITAAGLATAASVATIAGSAASTGLGIYGATQGGGGGGGGVFDPLLGRLNNVPAFASAEEYLDRLFGGSAGSGRIDKKGLKEALRLAPSLVAGLTPGQKRLVAEAETYIDNPFPGEVESQELLNQILTGTFLPGGGNENPFTQGLMDAMTFFADQSDEASTRDFLTGLSGITGGIPGSAAASAAIRDFETTQGNARTQTLGGMFSDIFNFERGNQMTALGLAPQISSQGLNRLAAVFPIAELPRAVKDLGMQRALGLFSDAQSNMFNLGNQATSLLTGSGTPSLIPRQPVPNFNLGGLGQLASLALNAGRTSGTPTNPNIYSPATGAFDRSNDFIPGSNPFDIGEEMIFGNDLYSPGASLNFPSMGNDAMLRLPDVNSILRGVELDYANAPSFG